VTLKKYRKFSEWGASKVSGDPRSKRVQTIKRRAADKPAFQLLRSKLSQVPVFIVMTKEGSTYLKQAGHGDQTVPMYLWPNEALNYYGKLWKSFRGEHKALRKKKEAPWQKFQREEQGKEPEAPKPKQPMQEDSVKVGLFSLREGLSMARAPPTESGLRDPDSDRALLMDYRFFPHWAEGNNAGVLQNKTIPVIQRYYPWAKRVKLPAYTVDGLIHMQKGGKELRPIFMSLNDCEAAIEAAEMEPGTPPAKIVAHDAVELLGNLASELEAGSVEAARDVKSIEVLGPIAVQQWVKSPVNQKYF
jgi:hypothetical protein